MPHGQNIKSNVYNQTLKTLQKRFRGVCPHKNVAEILLQHDNARPHTNLKHRNQSQNSDRLFVPAHHTAQILHPRFLPLLSPQICHPWETFWEWLRGYWTSEEVAASTTFKLLQGCWSWWKSCRKIRYVVHPSSYPMNMSKEWYDKLLAIKLCCSTFLATFASSFERKNELTKT
jgi:hypothetical protein